MIKMIPPSLDKSVKSNAERKVFTMIKGCELDGYCFHSVGLANHDYKSYAEADFIVLTKYGVLCLEVKGGQVSCQNGIWSFTNRFGDTNTKNEGPFQQADGAMHSVKNALSDFGRINIACGVIFPDIEFTSKNISVVPEIQMDYTYVGGFEKYLKDCHEYWDLKFRMVAGNLSISIIEKIRERIRDDLHYVPLLCMYAQQVETEMVRLTSEQANILVIAKNNPKLLVSGPAGSGKTLLAVEYAKMKAKDGNRILLLTYNKLLAFYLQSAVNDDSIKVVSFHSFISDYITVNPANTDDSYFNKVLPSQFYKYLCGHKMAGYDFLVIDEGQDLLKEDNLPCFDKLIKGGLAYGKWAIFFDANQSIFNRNFENSLVKIRKNNPTELVLTKNCRNVKQIANFNTSLTDIDTGIAVVDGEKVLLEEYATEAEAVRKLNATVDFLIEQGFTSDDIVIISPTVFDNSIVSHRDIDFGISLSSKDGAGIRYFTIQSFKGLESKIVLFVDYKLIIDTWNRQLLYTSLSRAKTLAYFFADTETIQKIQSKIIERVSKNGV
jgi:hypothetical protein